MISNDRPRPDASTATADLAVDLRALTGLRSRTAVRDRVLPALDARLGDGAAIDREARFAVLQELIDSSISRMTDPAHRHAAAELLGSGPHRWQPLTRRGPRASSAFQLGWDAYRRRRETTGASLLDDTLDALAATMLLPEDAGTVADAPPPATPPRAERTAGPATAYGGADGAGGGRAHGGADGATADGAGDGPAHDGADGELAVGDAGTRRALPGRRSPAKVAGVAAAIAVVLVAGFVVVRLRSGGTEVGADRNPTVRDCGALTLRPGDAAPGAPAGLTTWSAPFRSAASDAVPEARCASAIGTRNDSIFQEIGPESSAERWLLVAPQDPADEVIVLNPHEHLELRSTVWSGSRVTPLGPVVSRAPERSDGVRMVTLAHGALVQHHEDDRAFVVADRFHEHWLERGGIDGELGPPVSDRYERPGVGSVQDFARARLVADYEIADVTVRRYGSVDRAVLADLRGNVLRTPAGDAWFITSGGQRRWLPTGDDLTCARENHGADVVDAEASAVTVHPPGPAMRCL